MAQIDARGAVVGRFEVAAEWEPEVGSTSTSRSAGSATCARGRTDVETLKVQRRDVIWSTDARVYGPLQDSMKRADEEYRQTAARRDRGSPRTSSTSSPSRAVVLVRWTEQARGAAPPTSWSATLTVVHVAAARRDASTSGTRSGSS